MQKGRNTQLVKQIGEYLVASELARRHLLVATFSGNVPDFDLVAGDEYGNSIPIQVKTIQSGTWQFSVEKFVSVKFDGKKQILGKKLSHRIRNLLHVMVVATEYGKDRFFILEWEQLRDIAVSRYSEWLARIGGTRPKNYKSLHCSVSPDDLKDFEDCWDTIAERFPPISSLESSA